MSRVVDLTALSAEGEARLAAALAGASLACFPTDTVYGVGGRLSPATVDAVVRVKGRAPDKPLQVVFPTVTLLLETVPLAPGLRTAVERLLPGPLTLVVPYPPGLDCPAPGRLTTPEGTTLDTLGVRVPDWPGPMAAMARLPFPLLASSANPSGGADAARLDDVEPAVRAACDLLLDGGPTGGVSSTVLDLTGLELGHGWRILRQGAAGYDEIAARAGGKRKDGER
ncbi:MAG TPA: L-threonylcarbamoyladenylate synthase [Thermoleophilia bacterium]|nr:L-threonylcarbamoyladenylate synthase [Thermoleophilia bacterium]